MQNKTKLFTRIFSLVSLTIILCTALACSFAVSVSATDTATSAECTHEWVDMPSGSRMCVLCSSVCTQHSYVPHNVPYDSKFHNTIGICAMCEKVLDNSGSSDSSLGYHVFSDGVCTVCNYTCEHSFSPNSHTCYYCELVHPECTSYDFVPVFSNGIIEHYSYICPVCSDTYKYENPTSSSFYRPAPFAQFWNANLSSIMFEEYPFMSGSAYRPYQRFKPLTYSASNDYKGTIYLTNGLETFDTDIKAKRYLLIRLRYSDVSLIEMNLFGGDADAFASSKYKNYFFHMDNLVANEWINVVFDLSAIDCYYSVAGYKYGYEVNKLIDSLSLRFCALFTSAEGFVDFEYIALVDSLDIVDRTIHFFGYTEHTERYYLFDNNGISFIADSHAFVGDKCRNCGNVCAHISYENGRCTSCGLFAKIDGYDNEMGFFALFSAVYDAQANTFFSLLNYDILGINIASFIISIVVLIIVIIVFKKVN